MELYTVQQANIEDFSPAQCVYFLKKTYPTYAKCMDSRVKYVSAEVDTAGITKLKTISLTAIKERAMQALSVDDNALNNNVKMLSTYAIYPADKGYELEEAEHEEYFLGRKNYLDDWASAFDYESEPTANKFDAPVLKRAEKSVFVPSHLGFLCPTVTIAESLTTSQVACASVNPSAVALAARITDLTTYHHNEWQPKLYSNDFIGCRSAYTQVANEVAHMLNGRLKLGREHMKGVELTGLLAQQWTRKLKIKEYGQLGESISKATDRLHQPTTANQVTFKTAIGDFKAGTIKYALTINSYCQGIRGGDDKDNSVTDYAYFCGYAMTRQLAKAYVLSHDMQRLFDHVRFPLKFTGRGAEKKMQQMRLANTFYGVLVVDSLPVDAVPIAEDSALYRCEGINFLYSLIDRYVAVHYEDMLTKAKTGNGWAVQYMHARDEDLSNILPCTAVHTMACFINIGEDKIKLDNWSNPKETKAWVKCSVEVNRSRTFFRHYHPFATIVASVGMQYLVPDFRFISNGIKSIVENYEDAVFDNAYIRDLLHVVMNPNDYINYTERVFKNKQQQQKDEQAGDVAPDGSVSEEDDTESDSEEEEADSPFGEDEHESRSTSKGKSKSPSRGRKKTSVVTDANHY